VNPAALKHLLHDIRSAPSSVQQLFVFVFLVGAHGMFLGIFIFFFTELFYRFFFLSEIENLFFVRQAGLFLFCLGLFNIATLQDIRKNQFLVKVIIATKLLAVLFLITNAPLAAQPLIIYLAGFGDGLMAVLLTFLYFRTGFHPMRS
jgi:hypothetical protein